MNRNTELHFKNTPNIEMKRSKFEESFSHKTTFNTGDIIPIYVDADILPGDTVQMDMSELIRMATPIYPIMDNLYADVYWFFVPHRLVWEHWQEFWGENEDPWTQQTEYQIPQIKVNETGYFKEGSLADYMGVPTKKGNMSINALPFRAYAKIWNDWFRDENLKKAAHIYTDETTRLWMNPVEGSTEYITRTELGGNLCKAAKMHDYFTSALPQPQKGAPVQIPLGMVASVTAPDSRIRVDALNVNHSGSATSMNFKKQGADTNNNFKPLFVRNGENSYELRTETGVTTIEPNAFEMSPNNLWASTNGLYADLSSATAATINQLRTAFAIQKYYENAGLHGTRYIEYIRSVFGVTSSDARHQRAEYLGGQRIPLNIDQIIQTSSTDTTSPQGNTAGFSCTINRDSMFTKSFEEHGTLMGLCVIRTEHTYQQGLKRMWTRKKWTDFYNPFFANLGEQAILNKEIYFQGTSADDEAFGYQEAWADYRYKPNYVTGYMRSNTTGSLDVWHFADNYSAQPILGTTWIDEPYQNVDRTIAVTSQLTHQFIADFYFKCYYTRPMPVYSVPGLIDHV